MWGGLVGLIFLMPALGAALGAASGAVAGAFTDLGISDKFMKEVAASIDSGKAALFLLIKKMTTYKVLEDLKGVGGKVIQTSFDHTKEEALRKALQAATAAQQNLSDKAKTQASEPPLVPETGQASKAPQMQEILENVAALMNP